MEFTAEELAKKLGAELIGDAQLKLCGISPIENARKGDITFLANKKYVKYLDSTNASVVIVPPEIKEAKATLLVHPDPYYAFAQTMRLFHPAPIHQDGYIHSSAVIGTNCDIDSSAHVGANTVIQDNVKIGSGSIIHACTFIGKDSTIGTESTIYPNVTIRETTEIGDNVTIHSGTTIGTDGFGYAKHDGEYYKIPQVGKVVIENDVEIGANCTIDRATFGETRIGRGTKIDNLVQIGHNVVTGQNCILISQVGVSGSTKLGNGVILAGQVGLIGHVKVGDNVIVTAQSGVANDLEANKTYMGSPAREGMRQKRTEAILKKLPEYIRKINNIEKKMKE
jgi:UDP-3-O-[3-hydroxymyristoyl] glucosamine N-acyltransferase